MGEFRTQSSIWESVDTVLLDMDGTLLDLGFDNYFWGRLVPFHYGELNGLEASEVQRKLTPLFRSKEGTLEWYCLDYWSEVLEMDIHALKHAARERIRPIPGTRRFLAAVRQLGKRLVLVTNAHHRALEIKLACTGLDSFFDAVHTAHAFGLPKESERFWEVLCAREPFVPQRTLLADDSVPVLRAARSYGIAELVAITQPDQRHPARCIEEFRSVPRLLDLLPAADEPS